MTRTLPPSNYVYYRVRGEQATAARAAAGRLCGLLVEQGFEAPHLRRRPEASAQGLQTWMEVYAQWDAETSAAVDRALLDSGLGALIEGERHAEIFIDLVRSTRRSTRMTAYVIVEMLEVLDPASMQAYVPKARETVERHGGKYLSVRGRTEIVEGDWQPKPLVILEFPTMARAREWYDSAEYRPLIEMRKKAARCNLIFVEGL